METTLEAEIVSPESSEGRERIARLEERVKANAHQIEAFAPLSRAVERVQWNLDELSGDFKQFRTDLREQRAEDDKKRADELHELRRSFSDQILVVADGLKNCSTKIGEVADEQRKWQTAERDRRDTERERREAREREDAQTKAQKTIAKYGPTATLVAALLAFLGVIFQSLFGGG